MVSMSDVAEHAGVSKTTVSRVLNGKGAISESIRKKVLGSCEILGYRINAGIQELILKGRNRSTRNVAFVLFDRKFSDPAYALMIDSISEVMDHYNYQLLLAKLSGRETLVSELPPLLRDSRVDGLMVSGVLSENAVNLLKKMKLPCVVLGNYSEKLLSGLPSVRRNMYPEIFYLVRELQKRSCRKIAFVSEESDNFSRQESFHIFKLVINELGLDDDAPVYWREGALHGVSEKFQQDLFSDNPPFDGIFSTNFGNAMQIDSMLCAKYGFASKNKIPMVSLSQISTWQNVPFTYDNDRNNIDRIYQAMEILIKKIETKISE